MDRSTRPHTLAPLGFESAYPEKPELPTDFVRRHAREIRAGLMRRLKLTLTCRKHQEGLSALDRGEVF